MAESPPAARNASMSRRILALIAVLALALAILTGLAVRKGVLGPQPETAAVGGPFQLIDTSGRTVDQDVLKGKWSVVFFGFTHCPDICPTTLFELGQVEPMLGADADKFQAVLISVDPGRDTVAQMKAYVANDAFPKRLIGLTGTEEQIADMQKTYKVYAARAEIGGSAAGKEPARGDAHSDTHGAGHHEEGGEGHGAHGASTANYTVNHSGYIYFMSPDSQLISLFGDDDTPSAIADGIRSHLHRKH